MLATNVHTECGSAEKRRHFVSAPMLTDCVVHNRCDRFAVWTLQTKALIMYFLLRIFLYLWKHPVFPKVQILFKVFKGTDESAKSWSLYFDCHGLNTKAYQNAKNSKINKIKSNKHHFASNKSVFPHLWGRCASNAGGWRLASWASLMGWKDWWVLFGGCSIQDGCALGTQHSPL